MSDDFDESGTTLTMPSGVGYIELLAGTGAEAAAGSSVTVHYTGWLTSGAKFDSSRDGGRSFSFRLGAGQVIQGWDEGLPGMAAGGTRRLVIPPQLAYGDRGAATASGVYVVPPNTTLVFYIRLLSDTPNQRS